MKLKNGLVQVYTGNGKGKTTASLGLALRAAGAGLNVYIMQFIKGMPYSELKSLRKIKNIKLEQCGRGCFIKGEPKEDDVKCAREGLTKARKKIASRKYDVVILDEINVALAFGMIGVNDIIETIKEKPQSVELVLTGRSCPEAVFDYANLVTEMREVKHPYKKGIKARLGIEC